MVSLSGEVAINIFALDEEPYKAALWIDDLRKNKMILESVQILSVPIRQQRDPNFGYGLKNINHPVAIWARTSKENYKWLDSYTFFLLLTRGKPHKSYEVFRKIFLEHLEDLEFPQRGLKPFQNSAANASLGLDYRHIEPTVEAYRQYIRKRWELDKKPPTWNHGEEPPWR